jgi:hypothetical protein
LATLQVQILPLRLVPIAILRVTDPDSPGTALGATDPNGTIVDHLNRAFRQAQVQFYDNTWALFGGAYVDGVPLSYDVQPKDGILQTTNQAELNVVRNWVSTIGTNVLPIILMRQESGGYPNPLLPAALRPYRGRTLQEPDWSAVYTEPSRNILSPVAAHEVGHFLNLDHWPNELAIPGHPFPWDSGVQIEHVMRLGTPWPSRTSTNLSLPESWSVPQPGTWLNWESWTNANFQAKKKFP